MSGKIRSHPSPDIIGHLNHLFWVPVTWDVDVPKTHVYYESWLVGSEFLHFIYNGRQGGHSLRSCNNTQDSCLGQGFRVCFLEPASLTMIFLKFPIATEVNAGLKFNF